METRAKKIPFSSLRRVRNPPASEGFQTEPDPNDPPKIASDRCLLPERGLQVLKRGNPLRRAGLGDALHPPRNG